MMLMVVNDDDPTIQYDDDCGHCNSDNDGCVIDVGDKHDIDSGDNHDSDGICDIGAGVMLMVMMMMTLLI